MGVRPAYLLTKGLLLRYPRWRQRQWAGGLAPSHGATLAFQSAGESGKSASNVDRAERTLTDARNGITRGIKRLHESSTQPVSALVIMTTGPHLIARSTSAITLSCNTSSCSTASALHCDTGGKLARYLTEEGTKGIKALTELRGDRQGATHSALTGDIARCGLVETHTRIQNVPR